MRYFLGNKQLFNNSLISNCSVSFFKSWLEGKRYLGVDTETEGAFDFVKKVLSLQIGNEEDQFFIDFSTVNNELSLILKDFFLSKSIKIFHNAKFDLKFLWRHGYPLKNIYCTQVQEVLLHAGIDQDKGFYSLAGLCKRYFGVDLDKSIRGKIKKQSILTTDVILYALDDVKYLVPIVKKQMSKAKQYGLVKSSTQDKYTVVGLENRVLPAYAEMEWTGLKPNLQKWDLVSAEIQESYLEVINRLNNIIKQDEILKQNYVFSADLFSGGLSASINWASPPQKLKLLRLIFPEIENTDSKKTLPKYKDKHPIVKQLIEFNRINKLLTSFIRPMKGLINSKTGRIHTSFWQVLSTGRVSCKNPNIQQIPSRTEEGRKIRSCFEAPNGYSIVGGDYSGCELRIIADQSQDPTWLDAFNNDKDLHSLLCALTFNIDIKDVKSPSSFNPTISWRDIQKTINFGLAYGMSEYKLADVMESPVEQAKSIIETFFAAVPLVQRYLTKQGRFAVDNGYSRTPFPYGRLRFYNNYKNRRFHGSISRQGKNSPIQGGNADIIKLATIDVYEQKPSDVSLMMQIHDELKTLCPDNIAHEWVVEMQDIMQKAGEVIVKSVPMKCDCSISKHWAK